MIEYGIITAVNMVLFMVVRIIMRAYLDSISLISINGLFVRSFRYGGVQPWKFFGHTVSRN